MNARGFSLIEMLVALAVIAILTSLGTFGFSSQQRKARIDSQIRVMYGDLMQARSKALFEKRSRLIRVSSTSYALYSSAAVTSTPPETRALGVPVTLTGTADIVFDASGMLADGADRAICVMGGNSSPVDSIVVSASKIQLGKLDEGATSCEATKIVSK